VWTLRAREAGYDELMPELRLVRRFQTWIAPLPGDVEQLRAGWKKTQNNLWRSLKKGEQRVGVRESTSRADLRRFYRLHAETERRHRTLPRSWKLFRLSQELLAPRGLYKLVLAEAGGDIVAGAVLVAWRDNIDLVYNASSEAHLDLRPNHAIYWHAIRWGAENGYRTYNMGDAPAGGSLAAFKAQWGGVPTDRFEYHAGGTAGAADALRAASNRMDAGERRESVASRIWGRTPLLVTQLASDVSYRYL
jgi:lipid II:glycine glycyltransferase (peptidoglycan interpeptide bridge formation enzyme)